MQDPDSDAAPNEDYELNDDFIDDSEVYEFYEGDWRKPKHTGFYINNVSNSSTVMGIALNMCKHVSDWANQQSQEKFPCNSI